MEITEKQKEIAVKKHVAAIHCANELTLLQRKISNALLYYAYPTLLQKETHEITIKQLCHIIGYNGNNHAVIKEALRGLISRVIEWNIIDEKTGEEDWTASAMIASAKIKGSLCSYSYSPHMRELLYSPSMYGKINLAIQTKFHSSYGLALYENCVRYKGVSYTKWFDISLFRKLMGVTADKYAVFRDFKKRVIDKAVDEINSYSDIIVNVEINRCGHKVLQIRFGLKERDKKKWFGTAPANVVLETVNVGLLADQSLIDKLSNAYGFNSSTIDALLAKYSAQIVQDKINLIEASSSYQQGKIRQLSSYLIKALEDNYLPCKSSVAVQRDKISKIEDTQQIKIKKNREEERKNQQYSVYVSQYIEKILSTYSYDELERLKEDFKMKLKKDNNTITLNRFLKNGFLSKMAYTCFCNFLQTKEPEKFYELKNFSEFVVSNNG